MSKAESGHVRRRLEHLLEHHKEKYPSQTELARSLDMSQQVLSRILSGDAVGLHVARRVASLVGGTIDQVLGPPQTSIDDAVVTNPKRWSPVTIATVRAMPRVEALGSEEATHVLDLTEEALAPIRKELQKLTR